MIREHLRLWLKSWNEFWFTPRSVESLALMRILVGSMLIYTHAVWTIDLPAFLGGSDSALNPVYRSTFSGFGAYSWSHFDWMDWNVWLWGTHFLALVIFAMFTIGCWTRVTSVLAFLFVVSYANRATGALFGLDQINAFLTLYLAISNCGAKYSLDSRIWKEQGRGVESVNNNIATRLIQIHMCIVYLFAGLGKLQGTTWWNGEAVWGTFASYEYQTIDMTWLAGFMGLVNLMTYATVAWEVSYTFLIWPKLTRPIFLVVAVLVHLGIGFCMGMMTFGLIMLYGNIAFVCPNWIQRMTATDD